MLHKAKIVLAIIKNFVPFDSTEILEPKNLDTGGQILQTFFFVTDKRILTNIG
jgi:hypothetical protein